MTPFEIEDVEVDGEVVGRVQMFGDGLARAFVLLPWPASKVRGSKVKNLRYVGICCDLESACAAIVRHREILLAA